jgi:hypothetical protein
MKIPTGFDMKENDILSSYTILNTQTYRQSLKTDQ